MTPAALLAEVARRGVALRPGAGGTILVRPRGALPDELRTELRARRAEVLALLACPGPWPACPSCGRASGWRCSAEDPTVRCSCGQPRGEPEPDPRCVRCRAPLPDPGNLLCPSCYCAATAPKLARDPAGPVEIEPGDPATPTDGVRMAPPPAPEAQLDLLPGEAP